MISAVIIFGLLSINQILGECPNGCNGHGKCVAYDMCICQRNWQGNDCSDSKYLF